MTRVLPIAAAAALLLGVSPALAAPACPSDKSPTDYLCHAVAASDAQKFAEAAALFEQAAAASPTADARVVRMLAAAGNMWIAAGQPGKAAAALDRALADPKLGADQRGMVLLDRGRAAEAQNDLATARKFADLASASAGNDPFTWYFSAAVSVREHDITAAKVAIDKALALAPETPEFLFEAGFIAHEVANETAARNYWNKAITADAGGPIGDAAKRALDALGQIPPPKPSEPTTTVPKL